MSELVFALILMLNIKPFCEPLSQNMQHFNVIFHHGGEFLMVKDNNIIYKVGVDTIISSQQTDKWTMFEILKFVNGWGYKEGSYKILSKILKVDENFFQLRKDDDAPQCPKPKKENQSGGKVFALSGSETSADDRLIRGE
ncbi:hypothetical protein KIW84_024652 [Lathyrus oleraceus]|uniref:PB1-like domain-containing protein n=1 Tax=Pisum sativum TaxID=3888 RepID=A0A9D5BCI6_PEA|nr:hypothetical protein KIW84_024652 [Pisum sativum]